MTKWVKGQSGNPGGRPKVLGDLCELARQHAPAAFKELARLARNAKNETGQVQEVLGNLTALGPFVDWLPRLVVASYSSSRSFLTAAI